MEAHVVVLSAAFLAVAVLYSSVGHAGASGYLAAMALVGLAPVTMKPTALALNLLVSTVVTLRFQRAGLVRWRALLPFVVASVPMAFIGGSVVPDGGLYRLLVGFVLLVAAVRLFLTAGTGEPGRAEVAEIPGAGALAIGAAVGLLAGLTGTGGGIFLTPLLLFLGWAPPRLAAGMSAAFILANSLSGLAGNVAAVRTLPAELPLWLAVVAIGGLIGAELGARRLAVPTLRRVLGVVLVVAALKLFLVG